MADVESVALVGTPQEVNSGEDLILEQIMPEARLLYPPPEHSEGLWQALFQRMETVPQRMSIRDLLWASYQTTQKAFSDIMRDIGCEMPPAVQKDFLEEARHAQDVTLLGHLLFLADPGLLSDPENRIQYHPFAVYMSLSGHDALGKGPHPNGRSQFVIGAGRPSDDDLNEHVNGGVRRFSEWATRRGVDLPSELYLAIKYSHEKPDGTGYPDGVMGISNIPYIARLLQVLDEWVVWTSDRPYLNGNGGKPLRQAFEFMKENTRVWLDETIIDRIEPLVERISAQWHPASIGDIEWMWDSDGVQHRGIDYRNRDDNYPINLGDIATLLYRYTVRHLDPYADPHQFASAALTGLFLQIPGMRFINPNRFGQDWINAIEKIAALKMLDVSQEYLHLFSATTMYVIDQLRRNNTFVKTRVKIKPKLY